MSPLSLCLPGANLSLWPGGHCPVSREGAATWGHSCPRSGQWPTEPGPCHQPPLPGSDGRSGAVANSFCVDQLDPGFGLHKRPGPRESLPRGGVFTGRAVGPLGVDFPRWFSCHFPSVEHEPGHTASTPVRPTQSCFIYFIDIYF